MIGGRIMPHFHCSVRLGSSGISFYVFFSSIGPREKPFKCNTWPRARNNLKKHKMTHSGGGGDRTAARTAAKAAAPPSYLTLRVSRGRRRDRSSNPTGSGRYQRAEDRKSSRVKPTRWKRGTGRRGKRHAVTPPCGPPDNKMDASLSPPRSTSTSTSLPTGKSLRMSTTWA